jgi:type IV pilus assembly protein PilC
MPKYFYKATSPTGESESGVLEAEDEYELARLLRKKGCILISATEEKPKKEIKPLSIFGKVPIKEKLFFTRNFKLMIKTGVPLPKALEILSSQSRNKKFKKILLEVREEIIKGRKLSEALRGWPEVFSELFCSMIKVGEETGKLEDVLESLTKQIERTYELKSRVQGALVYPAVIVVAMIGIGILMLIMVVPPLAETFDELGIELPFTTRLVISTAGFMVKFWFIFPIIILILIFLIRQFSKTKKGGKLIDGLLLKIPIISPIIKETSTAYTSRTLSTLISSGVPIIKSLEVVSRTLNNFYFREAMIASAEGVRKGSKFSEALEPFSKIYPLSFSEMIAIGEETGETSSILEKLADFSEAEVEKLTKNLASAIEPVIMIIIGIGVGFFAVSMIQPMYSMLGGL